MGQDDRPRSALSRLSLKFGTVATAAAALLSDGNAGAGENDVLKGLLDRNSAVPSVSRGKESLADIVPPPLVLKPANADEKWLLAGHRSHSSHSSHRSHVSGSSHSSHFSSSISTGSGASLSPRPSARRSASSTRTYSGAPGLSAEIGVPRRGAESRQSVVAPERAKEMVPTEAESAPVITMPVPKSTAAPAVMKKEPPRYQLMTLGTVNGVEKALVKDLLKGNSRLMAVGDTFGEVTLVKISRQDNAIRLKPATGPEFTIERGEPAK